jgi:hypothetical protein
VRSCFKTSLRPSRSMRVLLAIDSASNAYELLTRKKLETLRMHDLKSGTAFIIAISLTLAVWGAGALVIVLAVRG